MARRVRIAVSVFFGVLTVLLAVMWVRSYWWADQVFGPGQRIACIQFRQRLPALQLHRGRESTAAAEVRMEEIGNFSHRFRADRIVLKSPWRNYRQRATIVGPQYWPRLPR